MSDDISTDPIPVSATEQPPSEANVADVESVLTQVRELRSHLGASSKPLLFPVPGYSDILVVRYRWVPFEELSRSAQGLSKIEKLTERQIAAACDTLVQTCDEIMIRVGEDIKPLALSGEQPYTFSTPGLGDKLGFPNANTPRENVLYTFQNEYALIATANEIVEWLQDTSKRVTGNVLGN